MPILMGVYGWRKHKFLHKCFAKTESILKTLSVWCFERAHNIIWVDLKKVSHAQYLQIRQNYAAQKITQKRHVVIYKKHNNGNLNSSYFGSLRRR